MKEPAFPSEVFMSPELGYAKCSGMYMRDYFAAAAMTGMLSAAAVIKQNTSDETIASCAYSMADAMMKAREGKP